MKIIWRGSPNKDPNSQRLLIDRIVIHWFGVGTLATADARFQDAGADVSAHYGVSGDTIYQWVADHEVAWHAGNYTMNRRSLGIEHDANTDHNASEKTYQASAKLIASLCLKYAIPLDREHIIKHSEVKATQCPGTMDLDRLIVLAKSYFQQSFTDQTKIPLGDDLGEMEVQAIRSTLLDQKQVVTDLTGKFEAAQATIANLKSQIAKQVFVFKKPLADLLVRLALVIERL